jgi:hypothetical protein
MISARKHVSDCNMSCSNALRNATCAAYAAKDADLTAEFVFFAVVVFLSMIPACVVLWSLCKVIRAGGAPFVSVDAAHEVDIIQLLQADANRAARNSDSMDTTVS